MAKGKATLNFFKTNSSNGVKVTIPKPIVDDLDIKYKDIFKQKIVGRHIEMEKVSSSQKNEEDTVSINQFKTSTSTQTTTFIMQDIVEGLKLKDRDIMLFESKNSKIIIKKF